MTFRSPVFNRFERQPSQWVVAVDARNVLGSTLLLNSQIQFFGATGMGPNYDYPNPRGYQTAIDLKVFNNHLSLLLLYKDQFFGSPGMGPDYDYPNPRGYVFSNDLRNFTFSSNLKLYNSDKPPNAQYDWPVPPGPRYPSDLRTFTNNLELELLNQDKFFGKAGQAPANLDWPVPKGAQYPIGLRVFNNPTTGLPNNVILQPSPNDTLPTLGVGGGFFFNPIDPNRYMVVGGRFRFGGKIEASTGSTLDMLTRLALITPKWAVKNPRFLFFNGCGYTNAQADGVTTFAETVTGNSITISGAAVETVSGAVFNNITFNGGSSSIVLASGAYVWSDPVAGLTLSAKAIAGTYYIRTDMNVASSGLKYPTYYDTSGCTNEKGSTSASSQTSLVNSGSVSGHITNSFGPIAMAGQGWDGSPVPLCPGDSVGYGAGDNMEPTRGVQGFISRGLDNNGSGQWAYLMWCVISQSAASNSEGSASLGFYGYRIAMLNALAALNTSSALPFTSILVEHGTNAASGVATINPAFWSLMRSSFFNVPIYQTTLTPHTNDSVNNDKNVQPGDYAWTDDTHQVPNQSAYNWPNGVIPTFNAALLAGTYTGTSGGKVNSVIDITPNIYDSSGNWTPPSFTTTLASQALAGTSFSMNAAPAVGDCLVFEPGTAVVEAGTTDDGGLVVATVSGTGPYTVTITGGPTNNTHNSSTAVAEALTNSGLHPNQLGNTIMAANVIVAKNLSLIS